jgi:flavorubredoxin
VDAPARKLVVLSPAACDHTRRLAQTIASGAKVIPGVDVSLHEVDDSASSQLPSLIAAADAVRVGAPAHHGLASSPVRTMLFGLADCTTRGKLAGAFGAVSRGTEAVQRVEERMRHLRMRVPFGGLKIRLVPSPAEIHQARAFGREFAECIARTLPR